MKKTIINMHSGDNVYVMHVNPKYGNGIYTGTILSSSGGGYTCFPTCIVARFSVDDYEFDAFLEGSFCEKLFIECINSAWRPGGCEFREFLIGFDKEVVKNNIYFARQSRGYSTRGSR